jgi:AcrR family transcriptional regulator
MARARSTRAHEQVLDAALKLFAERGIGSTSMDAIAEASGVSKATIYKHWPDKDALCLEVMSRLYTRPELTKFRSGDLRSNLVEVLNSGLREQKSEMQSRMMPHLMAYAARNSAFGMAWRTRVMEPPRNAILQLLKRAVAGGELTPELDFDLALALLLGPMLYCRLTKQKAPALLADFPEDFAERVVAAFWKAHEVQGLHRPKQPRKRSIVPQNVLS